MATFEKNNIPVEADCEKVFSFLGDFRNFGELLPDKVQNSRAYENSCSFTIEGLADMSMRIDGKSPCRSIHIVPDGKAPVDFSLDYFFHEKGDQRCDVSIIFRVVLNPFMKTVASGPLQKLVDKLARKLQDHFL
ncbi:MAG: hypothetical protein ACLFMU_05890 [Bacteroidales bacterium]